jgi:hypothetical protein
MPRTMGETWRRRRKFRCVRWTGFGHGQARERTHRGPGLRCVVRPLRKGIPGTAIPLASGPVFP